MIVSSLKQVDLLYALFLGRFPENNFVRQENIGRPALKIAEVMMGSDEFRASVLERFLLYQQLPHRGLPLQLLPTVLEFISEAGLAPPFTGVAITDWAGVLANVLCSAPCRKFLEVHGEVGERMRQQLLGISSPREMSEEHEAKRGATTETDIASGIEIIGNMICRGWIIDRNDPNALLHVRLRLNGRTVKITAADEFRRDVQALHGGAGRAGFTIRLDRLEDAPYLDRGSIEITELSCGAVVLPEQEVEFSPFPGTRVEAEVRETLIQLRAYLAKPEVVSDRQNATIPSRLWPAPVRSRRQHAEPESVNRDALLELLAQLEQQLRRLEYEQSWALPLYGAVRPLVGMVVSPPPISELVTFSIIILDHGGTADDISATLDSILAQSRRPAEICLLARPEKAGMLTMPPGVEVAPLLGLPANAAVNAATAHMTGSHFLLLDAGTTLAPQALEWFAVAIDRFDALVVYADSEIMTTTGLQPIFRSAFDYDLLLQRNYIGDTFCIERRAYTTVNGLTSDPATDARHDLLLRMKARFGRGAFAHLPLLLVRSPSRGASATGNKNSLRCTVQLHLDQLASAGSQAIPHCDAFGRTINDAVQIEWPDNTGSRLSVIIPTRDSADMVFASISSLRRHAAAWGRVEVLVIVNGDLGPRLQAAFDEIEKTFSGVTVISRHADFNWADMNNAAVRTHASGELLLFHNDDMICLTDKWDQRVRGQLGRSDIGVIGGRLLYPNGRIQHAGIAFGEGATTAHEAMGDEPGDGLYLDRTLLVHQVGAVTGALLACRRTLFDQLGGFDAQRYAITSSDADFCVRARLGGKAVLYDPSLTWIHHESVSRGFDEQDHRKAMRAAAEHERWRARFPDIDLVDLSVNPHLSRSPHPFEAFHRLDQREVERWLTAQLNAGTRRKTLEQNGSIDAANA